MDPNNRLRSGQQAFRERRYQDALNDYIWFHDHALEHDHGYYGVRLSFALAYWLELAAVYPQALSALRSIRDRKTNVLMSGGGDRELFHDVESINERLNELDKTYQLFCHLRKERRELADQCADLAITGVIAAGDFELASNYIPDPEVTVAEFGKRLNEQIAGFVPIEEPAHSATQKAYATIYSTDVAQVIDVLRGLGNESEGERLRTFAISLVNAPEVRAIVEEHLSDRGSPTQRSN